MRNLKRSQSLFPSIKTACEQAQHLLAEGKQLRDMIEHADEYMEGKGPKQASFVREAVGVASNLPGDQSGIADATSTIVDENGPEVRAIAEVAAQIPAPSTM